MPSGHRSPAIAHINLHPGITPSAIGLVPLRSQCGHSVPHGQLWWDGAVLHGVVDSGHLSIAHRWHGWRVVVEHLAPVSVLLLLLLVLLVDVADGVGLVVDVLVGGR